MIFILENSFGEKVCVAVFWWKWGNFDLLPTGW